MIEVPAEIKRQTDQRMNLLRDMTIDMQAEAARKRLQSYINRSAGQHLRAMREKK